MTEMERRGCLALHPWKVNYPPGSWAKKFGRDMADKAKADDWQTVELTPRQRKSLWKQVAHFRRQIRDPGLDHWARQQLARIEQDELAEQGAQQLKQPKPPASDGDDPEDSLVIGGDTPIDVESEEE